MSFKFSTVRTDKLGASVSFRLTDEEHEALQRLSGTTSNDAARQLVRKFLARQKATLGAGR